MDRRQKRRTLTSFGAVCPRTSPDACRWVLSFTRSAGYPDHGLEISSPLAGLSVAGFRDLSGLRCKALSFHAPFASVAEPGYSGQGGCIGRAAVNLRRLSYLPLPTWNGGSARVGALSRPARDRWHRHFPAGHRWANAVRVAAHQPIGRACRM